MEKALQKIMQPLGRQLVLGECRPERNENGVLGFSLSQ